MSDASDMGEKPNSISFVPITAEQTWPLRGKVLRPHHPLLDSHFPNDLVPLAGHFGAIESGTEKIVGVATIYPERLPHLPQAKLYVQSLRADLSGESAVWRLRGMATEADLRSQGFGGGLLQACIAHVRKNGGKIIWANARTPALRFYERYGFKSLGEEYDMPGIGPHYLICLIL